jgi:hypothetical protein
MITARTKSSRKNKKPISYKKIGIWSGVVIVILLYLWGTQPLRGSINFGICKVYIEQNTTYPHEIRYISLSEQPGVARIEYVIMNEFGTYESKTITCRFRPDPEIGVAVASIVINRETIPNEKITHFNLGIPAILANPPDLASPGILGNDLLKLWRGYD